MDPNDPLGLAGIDLEAMASAGREGGVGSNIDVDFSNVDPDAMASANQIMDQLRQQGWKPPQARPLPSRMSTLSSQRDHAWRPGAAAHGAYGTRWHGGDEH